MWENVATPHLPDDRIVHHSQFEFQGGHMAKKKKLIQKAKTDIKSAKKTIKKAKK